ncbi:MAG: hypothetical protein CSA81_03295 [Acidobacteria bacterium]|nr:MAG: hypothetical protein CSA81_03295 [Acidobacteriota bacterium]
MKKTLFMLMTMVATFALAQNTITLVPATDVHTGSAPGAVEGYIDANNHLDVSGMPDGSLVVFDVVMTGLDFTLGGYEFKVDYPVNLLSLSTDDAEWQAGAATSAIYVGSGMTAGSDIQWLPANADGTRNASTVANDYGTFRVGMLWTNAASRPDGSTTPITDTIGRISFVLDGRANCSSLSETVSITLTSSDPQYVPDADIFANGAAERVVVGSSDAEVTFGEPGLYVRADADANGDRNALDTLAAAYCSIAGQNDSVCCSGHDWSAESADVFLQVFDYNCDGSVTALDLLGNALLTVGDGNRSVSKNMKRIAMTKANGSVNMGFGNVKGGMGFVSLAYDNMVFDTPSISNEAESKGWSLVYSLETDTLNMAVFNVKSMNTDIPQINLTYKSKGEGSIALIETFIQGADMEAISVDLQLDENASVVNPEKVTPSKITE